ncbi:MAG: hypothetical protein ACK4V2_06710 [Pseudomonadota bacterium]|jgi:hypothetical protein|nr:hypothetical protein [Alphaproteobacteria bacterium]
MQTIRTKEVGLILLAIFCQMFSCLNLAFLNKYIETFTVTDLFFTQNRLDLSYWIIVTVFARIFGSYFVGLRAEREGVYKAIIFVSKIFVIISALCAAFCISLESNEAYRSGFYCFRFFYSLLETASLILPYLYILDRRSFANCYRLSALFLGVMFFAKLASYYLIELPLNYLRFWYVLPLLASIIAVGIYQSLQKSLDLVNKSLQDIKGASLRIKLLAGLLGAACAAGIFYHYFFGSYYSLNIKIIEPAADLGSVMYYSLCAVFFMPSAWICKKYNLYRVLQFSLIALLSIGIISVFITAHFVVDILQQVLFSFFTSLFITPLLGIVYKLYKESGDIKAILTAFVVGFGACTTLARFEQQFALQKGFGWVTYDISLLLCLLAVCSNKEFLEKKVTP